MRINEVVNTLRALEPAAIPELQAVGDSLGLAVSLQAGQGMGPEEASDKLAYFEVVATERALGRLLAEGEKSLKILREKVAKVDRLRLAAEVIAAVTGFFSATNVPEGGMWPRVLAGLACIAAVLSALIPRLATSDSGRGVPWVSHYAELVEVLAKAEATGRKLTVWLRAYSAKQGPPDPSDLLKDANDACRVINGKRLLLGVASVRPATA